MTTLHLRKSTGRSCLRRGCPLIPLAVCCFALCSALQAVTPAPDGGYAGQNTAEGQNALQSLTSGMYNNAVGYQALYHNTTGSNNSAEGYRALFSNTGGPENTAVGSQALFSNTGGEFTGGDNTAIGFQALLHNTEGSANTATGVQALSRNINGSGNTATGDIALSMNTTGMNNTAIGQSALDGNTTGSNNTAVGGSALFSGSGTTAVGAYAFASNRGAGGTAVGAGALQSNTYGAHNTALGSGALFQNSTGSNNIGIGDSAGRNLIFGSYNIEIGNQGDQGENRTIRLGTQGTQTKIFIAGIYGVNEGGTISPVYINSNGQVGTQPPASSKRFKKNITSMDSVSKAVLALKPVTFQYKSDASSTLQFGLIAEEVADANPDLVVRDEKGDIYSVRYDAVNAMLLNEFLKEHKKVEDQARGIRKQGTAIAELKSTIAQQQRQIEALTAGLQKVRMQIDVSKPASQTAFNSQ